MKTIELSSGAVVARLRITVMITRYDLIAAVCWALAKNRKKMDRKRITEITSKLIESRGVSCFSTLFKKHGDKHSIQAESIVSRYFPDLKETPRGAVLMPGKN